MNPFKYAQMMKYLTRVKKQKPDLPDVFPASQAPIPPKKESIKTMEAVNRFVRDNPRTEKAGGGMLVQPGFGGTRQGYGGKGSGRPGQKKSAAAKKALSETKQKKGFERYNTAYDNYDGKRTDIKKYTYKEWKNLDASQKNQAMKKVEMKLEPGAYKGEFSAMTEAQRERRRKENRRRYAESVERREKAIKKAQDYYYKTGASEAKYKKDMKKTKGKATLAKEKNRLLKYMETASVRFNNPKYEQILDKDGNFVGIKDKSYKVNGKFQVFVPFEQFETKYKNKKNYLPITSHRDYKNFDTFFQAAKRFKTEAPDTTLATFFQKYERVPTYSEIYNFFKRDPRFEGYRQNALEIHHRALMESKPTRNFQLTLFDRNNKATSILAAYNNPDRPEYKNLKLVDQQLKDLGVRVKVGGRMLGIAEELPEQSLDIAKKETIDLFKQKVKDDPKVVEQIAKKLQIQLTAFADSPQCEIFIRKRKADGGRIPYQTGDVSLSKCVTEGARNFNDGKFKTADQVKDAAKLLRGGRAVVSGLMKYGIIPELAYVGLEAAGRTLLGEKPTNALLKSIDTLTFGATDFGSGIEAEKFGKFSDQKLAVDKFRNSQALVNSLQSKLKNLEDISNKGGEGYVGDLTSDIQMTQAQLQTAQKALQENTVSSDIVQFIDRKGQEIADTQMAKSNFAKQSLKDQMEGIPGIRDYTDTESTRIFPKQPSQMDLNLNMFPTLPTDVMQLKTSDAIDLAQALRAEGQNVSAKDILAYRDDLKQMPLSKQAEIYGDEQDYGTQGAEALQPLAGGGIAKLAGVSSGPPPESGPNSQGLQGLMKRVRNL